MKNPELTPGMTIKAKDGYVVINLDLCFSYCDMFGHRVLSFYLRHRKASSSPSKQERFMEELSLVKRAIMQEKVVVIPTEINMEYAHS